MGFVVLGAMSVLMSDQSKAWTHLHAEGQVQGRYGRSLCFTQVSPLSTVTSFYTGCFQKQKQTRDSTATFLLSYVLTLVCMSSNKNLEVSHPTSWWTQLPNLTHGWGLCLSVFLLDHPEPAEIFWDWIYLTGNHHPSRQLWRWWHEEAQTSQ